MHHRTALRRRALLSTLSAGAALGTIPGLARAQDAWKPDRPIRFIVGFSAGGSADALARLLAVPMGVRLGMPVVVDNVPGAGATIAMSALVRSAADGCTIAMGTPGTHAINPALMGARLPFRVPADFTPITLLASQPNVLIVNRDLGIRDMAGFLAWVRAHPDAAFGSAGVGTSNHLCGELLNLRLGTRLRHVAYKGAPQVIADLLGGHIPMTFDNITTAAALAGEGRVTALAVTTAGRSAKLPRLPTLAESGLAGYDLASWQGLFAPQGLPAPVQQALHQATVHALNDAEVRQRLAGYGCEPGGMAPAAFARFLQVEFRRWGDIVREAGVTLD